ncbi:MAG: ABC transporter ATP-binding protein [Treponema sp.]|nr:ABC transporter ATP-binding protein [Treponema sp.]
MSNSIIQIKGLEKTYITDSERLTILKDLDLDIQEGTKVVIAGESGSGKSTLLNIIGGIDTVTKGSVQAGKWLVNELSEDDISEYRSKFLGLVFQFHYLLKDFTALENVYMPAFMAGVPKKEAEERAIQLLNEVGIGDRIKHLPSQLSGGERQRVAVARSLINNPKVILADEPTGNLDPANAVLIGDILFNMVDKYKATLVLVTHDYKIAAKGDVCYKIVNGKLEKADFGSKK